MRTECVSTYIRKKGERCLLRVPRAASHLHESSASGSYSAVSGMSRAPSAMKTREKATRDSSSSFDGLPCRHQPRPPQMMPYRLSPCP